MSALIIHDMEQGTEAWFKARMGMPTASEFSTILAKGKDGGASVGRRTYMHKLAGEIITGVPTEPYSNAHMERGQQMEAEARAQYAFLTDADVTRVGFITNGPRGCSPDGLIGDKGMLELKTALPHILIGYILKDEPPPEHKAQTQGGLWVAEREWLDLSVYWPNMPPFIKRIKRDEPYITDLAKAVDAFNAELAEVVEKVRKYGSKK